MPEGGPEAFVVAESDGLIGFAIVPTAELANTTIELSAPQTTRVRVQDTSGRPYHDAPVRMQAESWYGTLSTAQYGAVQLHELRRVLAKGAPTLKLDASTRWRGESGIAYEANDKLHFPVDPGARAELGTEAAPDEVLLVTRPKGRFMVELIEPSGKPAHINSFFLYMGLRLDEHAWFHRYRGNHENGQLSIWLPVGTEVTATFQNYDRFDDEADRRKPCSATPRPSGDWLAPGLPPGLYDVAFIAQVRGIRKVIKNVRVIAGETTEDERLTDLGISTSN